MTVDEVLTLIMADPAHYVSLDCLVVCRGEVGSVVFWPGGLTTAYSTQLEGTAAVLNREQADRVAGLVMVE